MPDLVDSAIPDDEGAPRTSSKYEIYPVYAHRAHPLDNVWIKLPTSLVQKLHVPRGFEASNTSRLGPALPLFHYINHPVSFVHVCGVVVGLDFNDSWDAWIFQIDDGSGIVLQAICKRSREETNGQSSYRSADKLARHGELIKPLLPDWKGRGWTGYEEVDTRVVQVGRVLRVKGKITEWKGRKQILVERIFSVSTTAEEVQFWQAMCDNFKSLLCKPWALSTRDLRLCYERAGVSRGKHRERRKTRKERGQEKAVATIQQGFKAEESKTCCKHEPQSKVSDGQKASKEGPFHRAAFLKDNGSTQKEGSSHGVYYTSSPEPPRNPRQGLLEKDAGDRTLHELHMTVASKNAGVAVPIVAGSGHVSTNTIPSLSPTYNSNQLDLAVEVPKDKQKGAVIISRGSPRQWDSLEPDIESPNEPPPSNQLALKRLASTLFNNPSTTNSANVEMSSTASVSQILNAGLPDKWDQLDGSMRLKGRHASVMVGVEWIAFRRRNGAAIDQVSHESQPSQYPSSTEKRFPASWTSAKQSMFHKTQNTFSAYKWEDEWDRMEL